MAASNTAQLLIQGAIRLLKGRRYRVGNQDYGIGLTALNDLIASWSLAKIMVPYAISENFPTVIGQVAYTIGPSGDINTVRPTKLLPGTYIRDASDIDHPVDKISRERYNSINTKTSTGRPNRIYYDPVFPIGTFYFNKEPIAVETVYIDSLKPITEISDMTASLALPSAYRLALKFNLAIMLAPDYNDIKIPQIVAEAADSSKRALGSANSSELPESRMDPALLDTTGVLTEASFEAGK